jgi:hypothetical protein
MENYSNTLKELLETKVGYRNDHYSTGHYCIKDVLDFEIIELGNEDIPETVNKFYNTNNIWQIIFKHFPNVEINKLWGLWLTSKQGVIEYYKGKEEGYNSYLIPDNALAISDIDDEGVLFVIDVHPSKLLKEEDVK